ncbi:hypothetical protein F5X98DRAFT_302368 [Xylaria grammica]|nr:hypothetical protein F5X98DRAFT_302368 [Xylaria grammica]
MHARRSPRLILFIYIMVSYVTVVIRGNFADLLLATHTFDPGLPFLLMMRSRLVGRMIMMMMLSLFMRGLSRQRDIFP